MFGQVRKRGGDTRPRKCRLDVQSEASRRVVKNRSRALFISRSRGRRPFHVPIGWPLGRRGSERGVSGFQDARGRLVERERRFCRPGLYTNLRRLKRRFAPTRETRFPQRERASRRRSVEFDLAVCFFLTSKACLLGLAQEAGPPPHGHSEARATSPTPLRSTRVSVFPGWTRSVIGV